jgi:hypothetical protein
MWLFGAGASAAAGIPTADQLVWRFKRELYLSREARSPGAVEDLASPKVHDFLQAYFDGAGVHPARWAMEEYSHYFELCYPREADRRAFIDEHVRRARPSNGHAALAALVQGKVAEVLWTTNFDRTIEDAIAKRFETTSDLRIVTTESSHLAAQALAERALPLLVKLHGDFHSRSLKNTTEELRQQDGELRRVFLEEVRRKGLGVVGYSGRDNSIMATLEEAAKERGAFPGGLFWFHRPDGQPTARVLDLIARVNAQGGEAAAIPIGAFDELFGDVARHLDVRVPEADLARRRLSKAPQPATSGTYPALRFNAIPIAKWPQTARLIDCRIGGSKDVQAAIADANVPLLAVRVKGGVLGFGADEDFERAFSRFDIARRDLQALSPNHLHSESMEVALLTDALCLALTRALPLSCERRSWRRYLTPTDSKLSQFSDLRKAVGELSGVIAKTRLRWREAIHVRIDQRFKQLWLVFEPTVLADHTDDEAASSQRSSFIRSRLAERYNQRAHALVAAWADILTGGAPSKLVSAFGSDVGVDAQFELSNTTAFSWRADS